MKKILMPLILLILGTVVGGGAAYAVSILYPIGANAAGEHVEEEHDAGPTRFVRAPELLVPIVTDDGRLSGYARFTVMFEVAEGDAEDVGANMPLFLHEMNLNMWKTPLAAGNDKLLPDTTEFSKLAQTAADKVFEKTVHKTVIVDIIPV